MELSHKKPLNLTMLDYFDVLHSSPIFIQLTCRIPALSMFLQAE